MENTAANIEFQSEPGTAPLSADPVVGEVSFLPSTWDEIRVGDELISLSGTSRLALSVSESVDHQLQFDFLTTKPGREPQRESLRSNRLLVTNLRSVQRRCRDTLTQVHPKHWSEIRYGDLLVGDQGTRRIVTGITALGTDREVHSLARSAGGAIQFETIKTSLTRLSSIAEVLRYEQAPNGSTANLPPPPGETGSLPLGLIQNVEALLGRGELGDTFMMVFWQLLAKSSPDSNGKTQVDIAFTVDAQRGEFTEFSATPRASSSQEQGYIRVIDDGESPSIFTALLRPRDMTAELAMLLRQSLFLANILRGVGKLGAPRP